MRSVYLITFLICCLCLNALPTYAKKSSYSAIPGGILDLKIAKKSASQPLVRFGLQEVLTLEGKKHWRILAGIPLHTLPGDYLVSIHSTDKSEDDYHLVFSVQQQQYKNSDEINQANVAPNVILDQLNTLGFDHSEIPDFPFEYPTTGNWQNDFGDYLPQSNGKIKQQTFVSQTIETITGIHTPQKGIISNQWQSNNGTNFIAISHGRGVYSVLAGLDELIVKTGDGLHKGALIGKSIPDAGKKNKTIRWYSVMNNTLINPELFLEFNDTQ